MNLKNIYKTDNKFKEKTRTLFLISARQKFGEFKIQTHRPWRYFVRGLVSGVVLILLLTNGGLYANERNVNPLSLLYPLKRYHETIRKTFAKTEEMPNLYLELAERRIDEIEYLKNESPESYRIGKLSNDLKEELESSLSRFDQVKNTKNKIAGKSVESENQELTAPARTSVFGLPAFDSIYAPESLKANEQSLPYNSKVNETKPQSEFCNSWIKVLNKVDKALGNFFEELPEIKEKFETECAPFESFYSENPQP